ncbi:MAG TPA: hypothetical protein PKA64_14200 [Myxococcota bacterium]|nr:hypothetical protein [Myxococcota bacterium]
MLLLLVILVGAALVGRALYRARVARRAVTHRTVSGVYTHPFAPRAADIRPSDLAHALARICRFQGSVPGHYSVAQHSVLASYLGAPGHELAALLHDAAEALTGLGDLSGPTKRAMPWPVGWYLRRHEARVEAAIAERFGLEPAALHHPAVKHADHRVLATEDRDLRGLPSRSGHAPAAFHIRPMLPDHAAQRWIERLAELAPDLDLSADLERLGLAEVELTDTPEPSDLVDRLLLAIDVDVREPLEAVAASWRDEVATWSEEERRAAARWAVAVDFYDASEGPGLTRPVPPPCIERLSMCDQRSFVNSGFWQRAEVGHA